MDTIIIGGGIAGLVCAKKLQAAGHDCQILEATDRVGGRIKTDNVDGFLLDHGFQVLLTAYPEARAVLDYDALRLRAFEPGALIQCDGLHRLVDPWRRPQHLLSTAFSKAATFSDKLKVRALRGEVTRGGIEADLGRKERSTMEFLQARGFSDTIIERFFRPFFGGIFLERELETSSHLFAFIFQMFSKGDAVLPENGMEEIPKQLAAGLKDGTVRTGTRVEAVEPSSVTLAGGEKVAAQHIVIATEEPAATKLLGEPGPEQWRRVGCHYFAADAAPFDEAILMLNGAEAERGPINNLCIPSLLSKSYAPAGKSLISVSTLGNAALGDIQSQLTDWFGKQVETWDYLETYDIRYALPAQTAPALAPEPIAAGSEIPKLEITGNNIFRCGDYLDTASINGAMASGRRAAEAILEA